MSAKYLVIGSKGRAAAAENQHRFALDVLIGLGAHPKHLPTQYFYDARGSELYNDICTLPEYYLTRVEAEILQAHHRRFERLEPSGLFNLIELGAGDGRKSRPLLECFREKNLSFRYIPIDICEEAIHALTTSLSLTYPTLPVQGLVSEYLDGIDWVRRNSETRNIVLFIGATIGNFTADSGRALLMSLWEALNGDDYVVVGFDLKKDPAILQQAYADSQGITRAFNLNLLQRINRELGGEFDVDQFEHVAAYNCRLGAMESFLVSRVAQSVPIHRLGRAFSFEAWEPVHVEMSRKWSKPQIESLAAQTGFKVIEHLADARGWYIDSVWQCLKGVGDP